MSKFLDFISTKKKNLSELMTMNESINDNEIWKAFDLIHKMFKKNIEGKVLMFYNLIDTKIDNQNCKTLIFLVENLNKEWITIALNWMNFAGSNEVYSISLFDGMNLYQKGKDNAKVTIYTMGASIVYFMPLIYYAVNNKDWNLSKRYFKKYSKNIFIKESFRKFYVGALDYNIYEGLSDDYIYDKYVENLLNRVDEVSDDLMKVKRELYDKVVETRPKIKEYIRTGNLNVWKNLEHDYYAIVKAIKGGAEDISDLDIEFRSNITMEILNSASDNELEKQIEQEKEDPEVAWKEMYQYVKMVINGTNPSMIICGAPGAGKTFKIKKQLKEAGYVEGKNLCTIKGKCTPRELYMTLYQYKNKGDIIVIDDADSVVGPKAPEDVINILKGALDSTSDSEGRLVSYMVTGKIQDSDGNPIPKRFYYNGGVIIITNYRAGQLDTALRGRSYVQDINFSLEDMLIIIKRIMPKMGDGKLSDSSKNKAFKYIENLSKDKNNDIEISLRTFNICATLYESAKDDPDFSDEDTNRMIKKLLKLQAARGGKKY